MSDSLVERLTPERVEPATFRFTPSVLIVSVCILLMLIAVALFQSIRAEQTSRAQAEKTAQVLDLLRDSLRAGIDAETGQRGFLLTGDVAYLTPYARGSLEWLPKLAELRAALAPKATAEQLADLDALERLAAAKLDELARTVDLAEAGQREAALDIVRTDEGKNLMQDYRLIVDRLETHEARLLRDTLQTAAVIEARTLPALIVLMVAIVLLVIIGLALERRTAAAEASAREAEALRRAHARSDLLARELNHRVKNLFAVILSIVSLSGRGQGDVRQVVNSIRSRIHALSLAHAVSQGQLEDKIISMSEVIAATLAPYRDDNGDGRVQLEGEPVALPVAAVTPLGMVIHELATNAAKYGALSTETGLVMISWSRTPVPGGGVNVVLEWRERGGPPVPQDRSDGFGAMMIKQASLQLGGTVSREWHAEGLVARIIFETGAEKS